MQRYIYLRVISFDHFCKIFQNCEVDTDLLLILCQTFTEQVTDNATFNNQDEQQFVYSFLDMLATVTTSFDFVLELLGADEKKIIADLIQKLVLVETTELKHKFKI